MILKNSISIIIPLYNKENYVKDCVNSILSQSVSNVEIVVVNDGSTDKSVQKVKEIDCPNIFIYSQENQGPASARNLGISKANGDWCIFLDADDVLLEGSLKKIDNLIANNDGYNIFVCNYYSHINGIKHLQSKYKKGKVNNNYYEYFKGRIPICAGSTIYRKSVLTEHPQKNYLRRYEDLESLLEIMRVEKIYRDVFPVMVYNQDLSSASKKRDRIDEDFLGHLSFSRKSFWERAILWSLYEQAKQLYPTEIEKQYHWKFWQQADIRLYFLLVHLKVKMWAKNE